MSLLYDKILLFTQPVPPDSAQAHRVGVETHILGLKYC